MDFERPLALLLFGLLPVWAFLFSRHKRWKSRAWNELGRPGRVPAIRLPLGFFLLSMLILALAGPRIGRQPGAELPPGRDVVLLIDASRSMAAEDAVPNRSGAAAAAAESLVRTVSREPGDRLGVVAFAGGAEPRCPLTDRVDAVVDAVKGIRPGGVQPGGTNLGGALAAALDAFDDQEPADGRAIVVFTDGEDLADSWTSLLERLRAARVVVHGVTFGDDAQGHELPVGAGRAALRYHGEKVLSKRNDAALSRICAETGGILVPVGQTRADLGSLYRDRIAPMDRVRRAITSTPERIDRSSWFVAGALGLIGSSMWPRSRRASAAVVLLAVGIGAGPAQGTIGEAMYTGRTLYSKADYQGALAAFEAAAKLRPAAALSHYNVAASLYQLGRYEEAEQSYLKARSSADVVLTAKIDYAVGNVMTALGRYKDAVAHYDTCLGSRAKGPEIIALKEDARANRRFAETRIPPPAEPDPDGRRRVRGPDENQVPDSDPQSKGQEDPSSNNGASSRASSPDSQKNGPNGATGASDEGASPKGINDPNARLDAMMARVRKAQAVDREGSPPPPASRTDRKDW